mmetsp:Transcript_15420/g.24983  ORF Transcript_15420/g.24983 Transcript_15420/m.24983 type:complete len:242 (-) Transcript_15420:3-728(-)
MKIAFTAAILSLATSSKAFSPASHFRTTSSRTRTTFPTTQLGYVSSDETAEESLVVKEAMEISRKYGPSSPEARIAWEVVDEISHASDNREVMKKSLDDECEIDDDASLLSSNKDCLEYAEKLYQLDQLIRDNSMSSSAKKPLEVKDVPRIQLQDSTAKATQVAESTTGSSHPDVIAAIENAKRITNEHGIDSAQARVAWEVVEELASSVSHAHDSERFSADPTSQSDAFKEFQRVLNQKN